MLAMLFNGVTNLGLVIITRAIIARTVGTDDICQDVGPHSRRRPPPVEPLCLHPPPDDLRRLFPLFQPQGRLGTQPFENHCPLSKVRPADPPRLRTLSPLEVAVIAFRSVVYPVLKPVLNHVHASAHPNIIRDHKIGVGLDLV